MEATQSQIQEMRKILEKNWKEMIPESVKEMKEEGSYLELLEGAATLSAEAELGLLSQGFQPGEARMVALAEFGLERDPKENLEDDEIPPLPTAAPMPEPEAQPETTLSPTPMEWEKPSQPFDTDEMLTPSSSFTRSKQKAGPPPPLNSKS